MVHAEANLLDQPGPGLGRDERIELLGVPVAVLDLPALIGRATTWARTGYRATIGYANVHTLNLAWEDAHYRALLRGMSLVYCDGAGVVLAARLLDQYLPGRLTGADWIGPLAAACAATGLRLFLLGSRPGVAECAAARLARHYPGLHIAGTHHGYLDSPAVNATALATIQAARPDLLLVGMGSPRQEQWVAAHRATLDVPVVWCVGALFDFVAGELPRGPRWMLDHGLEWLARLAVEPKRLWRRYLLGNPRFLWRVLRQRLATSLPYPPADYHGPVWPMRVGAAIHEGYVQLSPAHRQGQPHVGPESPVSVVQCAGLHLPAGARLRGNDAERGRFRRTLE